MPWSLLLSQPPWLVLDYWLNAVIWVVGVPVGLYAFVHALMQRSDAFTAVDKLTKPAWAGITGAGAAVLIISSGPTGGTSSIFWLVAVIAVLVYLCDVRPKVVEVQQGPRW